LTTYVAVQYKTEF